MRTFVFKGIFALALAGGIGTVAAAAAPPEATPVPAASAAPTRRGRWTR